VKDYDRKSAYINEDDIGRVVRRISHEILERNKGSESLVLSAFKKEGYRWQIEYLKILRSLKGQKLRQAGLI